MRSIKSFTDVVTRKHMKAILISHSLGLQKSTSNQIWLNEMVV